MPEPDKTKQRIDVAAIRINDDIPEMGITKGSTAVAVKLSIPTNTILLSSQQAAGLALLLINKAKIAQQGLIDDTIPLSPKGKMYLGPMPPPHPPALPEG